MSEVPLHRDLVGHEVLGFIRKHEADLDENAPSKSKP